MKITKIDSCDKSDKYLKHYVECNKLYIKEYVLQDSI